jgi:hypothetical protein
MGALVACAPLLAQTLLAQPLPAQARWRMQYFYDKAKSALAINDIHFASGTRGVAVGAIQDGKGQKPVALVTSDGGAHWETVPLKEIPVSLFFLNETLGWMVTEKGLWQTTEAGKNWRKLPKLPAPPFRVYFADEKNGWAACSKKTVLETHDGGEKWTPIKEAAEPPGVPERSGYTWIAFPTAQYGLITGFNQPANRWGSMFPTWMDPENVLSHRETPHLAYTLATTDGGKTWKSGSASLFGQVTRIRVNRGGVGLGLIEYSDSFRYPSEAYKLDWKTGKNETIYRDKKFAITDVWLSQNGTAFLAGVEVAGEVRSVLPGSVKVYQSRDFSSWTELAVDYRAVAQRATLAAFGEDLWLATDSGMILKLQNGAAEPRP